MSVTVLYYTVMTYNTDISIRMNAAEAIENEIEADKLLTEISFIPRDRDNYAMYDGMYTFDKYIYTVESGK